MDSIARCIFAMYIAACISVCLATNVSSSSELSPSPSMTFSSITPSGTFNGQLLATSSEPFLPSELQSPAFQTLRPTPVHSTLNISPTPALRPTPVPSMNYSMFQTEIDRTPTLLATPTPSISRSQELVSTAVYSTLQPELLHTPTPSSSISGSQESSDYINSSASSELLHTPTPSLSLQGSPESPTASPGTTQTSQIMNASSSEPFLLSSTPFIPPPIPPPFPTFSQLAPTSVQPTPLMPETSTGLVDSSPSISQTVQQEQSATYKPMATPSVSFTESIPMTSATNLLPSPFPFPTSAPQDNETVTTEKSYQDTSPETQSTSTEVKTLPPKLTPIKCIITLKGDCEQAKSQKRKFGEAFANFIANILKVDIRRLTVQSIRCGSIIVDFILRDSEDENLAEDLMIEVGEGNLTFQFDNQTFIAIQGMIRGPKPTKKTNDDGGWVFKEQERLVYIIIASIVGFVIISSLILLIHHRVRKSCGQNAQSFDIRDEPHIKLSDFNMAHTYIPRPRSIYGSRLGAEGVYFHNNGSIHRGGLHSPTPYVYADDDAIRQHYHEVVDRETGPAAKRTSQDFGRSGVPELNLPRLEGVFQEGQEEDPIENNLLRPLGSRRGSDGSTISRLSATFHGPANRSPPTPPLPTPPPVPTPPPFPGLVPPTLDLPPPPPLPPPTPTLLREATLLIDRMSQVSFGSSSEATISLHGDTGFLLYKGCDYDPQPEGVDNPSYEKGNMA